MKSKSLGIDAHASLQNQAILEIRIGLFEGLGKLDSKVSSVMQKVGRPKIILNLTVSSRVLTPK